MTAHIFRCVVLMDHIFLFHDDLFVPFWHSAIYLYIFTLYNYHSLTDHGREVREMIWKNIFCRKHRNSLWYVCIKLGQERFLFIFAYAHHRYEHNNSHGGNQQQQQQQVIISWQFDVDINCWNCCYIFAFWHVYRINHCGVWWRDLYPCHPVLC